jgi:hypothetical protein
MDDNGLRDEIEKRVRDRAELAWSARVAPTELTEEEKQAELEAMPEAFQKYVEEHGRPEPKPLTDEAKQSYIHSETNRLYEVAQLRRGANGVVGPVSDAEWDETFMDRIALDMDAMLAKLRAQPNSPIGQALIEMIELGKEDARRSVTTDEELSELSQRMAKQFEDLTERIKKGDFHNGVDVGPHEN